MPEDSFIRLVNEQERHKWLPILHAMYEHESDKVSGPWAGLYRSDIRNCTWTKAEMTDNLRSRLGTSFSDQDFDGLLDRMEAERHLLKINDPEPRFEYHGEERSEHSRDGATYISRMAEMVRTIGSLHSWPSKEEGQIRIHHQLVEGTKWEPRLRKQSPRNRVPGDLVEKVRSAFDTNPPSGPLPSGSTLEDAITDLELVLAAIDEDFQHRYGSSLKMSDFQLMSIYNALLTSWSHTPPKRGMVITADTGAGKTLAFDTPAIVDAIIENRMAVSNNEPKGLTQLLLYPRNDLAKDQRATLKGLLARVNDMLIDAGRSDHVVTVAIDAGGLIKEHIEYIPSRKPIDDRIVWDSCKPPRGQTTINVYKSSNQKYAGIGGNQNRPASIMIASIESFRRRMSNAKVASAIMRSLRRVVLDEIHLSGGIGGAHHAFMMKRIQQLCYGRPRRLTFIGASATIAKPREHAARIWHCEPKHIEHVDSQEEGGERVPMSIMNHILVRGKRYAPLGGLLVDLTSAVGHQRRARDFHQRPSKYKDIQKMIGFADSHDVVGNWMQLSHENERTSKDARIINPNAHDQKLPYSHWFSRPLEAHPGGTAICNICVSGNKSPDPISISIDDVRKITVDPNDTLQASDNFEMNALRTVGDIVTVSGLDSCPYLQAGTCWHFSPRTRETEPTPGPTNRHSYRDVLRVKKHTSKSNSDSDMDDNANHTFRETPRKGAYLQPYVEGDNSHCKHDVVIATPTLEVGIDMSNVTDVLTHKAIRNISSYRQKGGRGGREPGTDSVVATLVSPRQTDFIHYRSTSRLIDRSILEPVPLADRNLEVMRTESYMAVYDWLSKNDYDIEWVFKARPGEPEWRAWGNSIHRAKQALINQKQQVLAYLEYGPGSSLDADDRHKAIYSVIEHLEALLAPYPCIEDPKMRVADLISWRNRAQSTKPETTANPLAQPLDDLVKISEVLSKEISNLDQSYPGTYVKYGALTKLPELAKNAEVGPISALIPLIKSAIDEFASLDMTLPLFMAQSCHVLMVKISQMPLSGQDPALVRQIRDLKPLTESSYLIQILTSCKRFQESSPYVMIGTLFQNPYENPVSLRQSYFPDGISPPEPTTSKDALRYYLPGMWTFRAFNGQPLRIKSGFLDGDPAEWVEHLDPEPYTAPTVSEQTFNAQDLDRIPLKLRADLDSVINVADIVALRVEEIFLEKERGIENNLQQVGFVRGTELVAGFDAPASGFSQRSRRPKAFSTTWDITKSINPEKVTSYQVDGMKQEGINTIQVTRSPLIGTIFSQVEWTDFEVQRLATCVTRSNGLRIRFRHNGRPAVYRDTFETEGISFTISDLIRSRSDEQASSWRQSPFDTVALSAFRAIVETSANIGWNLRYALDSFVECLLQLAYSIEADDCPADTFPSTFGQFIDIVSTNPLTGDIIAERAQHGIGDRQTGMEEENLNEIAVGFSATSQAMAESMEVHMREWARDAFCNTMSLLVLDAAAAFSGVPVEKLAYSFDVGQDGEWRIQIFDEDAKGNGSMCVIKDYFQILIETRDANAHFQRGHLPTSDFISELERRMLTCIEHIAQSLAIEQRERPPMINDETWNEATNLREEYKTKSWDFVGAKSVREAALHNLRRFFIVPGDYQGEFTLDFHRQALELCDSGCPACNEGGIANAFRGPLESHYTSRALVDRLVSFGPDMDGYLLKNTNEKEISSLAGKDIEPHIDLIFLPAEGGSGSAKRLVHYPTPPIGIHWVRGGRNSEPDWLVKHQESL
jgi:hypothetical protein